MLALSIVFFISAFYISWAVKKYYSPSRVTQRMNSEILVAFFDLENEINQVAKQNIGEKASFREFLDKTYKNTFSEKGIEILVYERDSLKYWSDNVFAAPEIKDSENFTSEIVRSGSGYYLVKQKKIKNFTIVALQLIRFNYKYLNNYLPSGFYKKFSTPQNVAIDLKHGDYKIISPNGKYLFSLNYEQPFELVLWLQYLIFTLYVASYLLLVSATFTLYMFLMLEFRRKWMLFLGFVADVALLRAIQLYFRFPDDLYGLQFFNPAYFASSRLLPSVGDFLINALLGLQIAYFAFKSSAFSGKKKIPGSTGNIIIAAIFLCLILVLFSFLVTCISSLVLDSSISFRFENVLSLPHFSHLGMLILSILIFGFLLVFELLGQLVARLISNKKIFLIMAVAAVVLFSAVAIGSGGFDLVSLALLSSLLLVSVFFNKQKKLGKIHFSRTVFVAVLLTALATYLLNKAEIVRENEKRKLLATHLADARDNLAEYYFIEAVKNIRLDKRLESLFTTDAGAISTDEVSDYVKDKYFSGYWSKYIIQVTICLPDKKINIMPGNIVSGCESYFDGKISQFMRPVSVPGLYFLRHSVDAMYYLGKIPFPDSDSLRGKNSNIFVEISSNDTWKGLGYPELLIDQKNTNTDNLNEYSYAFYNKGELVKNFGKYSYDIDCQNINKQICENGFYNSKGYSHYIFKTDRDTIIVLSKELPRIYDLISPFSYIFLLLMVMLLVVSLLTGYSFRWKEGIHTFRLRLQVIMISVIVASSILLVTVSLLFINMLNRNKNNEILSEKLNSVQVDLESRYGSISTLDLIPKDELSDLLISQSNTYFTDVNLYSTEGFLLASSRDQVFREEMISEQMSPSSANQLMLDKKSLIIERENIGTYSFLSAYTPLRNIDNQLLGYLNLPYFAKQEEIRREISGLVSAFANIYIMMIVITVLLALLLSRYITSPMQRIGKQFSLVKIGDKNAKIDWKRKDEIGRLVDEYNRMIDEMEKSAELLARSERESAWRQMARQVAHEIKNPLTPIKLSMQLLMKAWNDKAPDWEIRLKRFSQTLIMQIDTLSAIASEFSDFAQMPEPQMQEFDVIPIVQQSVSLFRDQSDWGITFKSDSAECFIKSDQNQILRVFNNLIKNALQAIPANRQGEIVISLNKVDGYCVLGFQDNGSGIPTEQQTRIFSPNFTTKTAGMGLGLAMVKNIIDHSAGRIWFETTPGEGSTFYVSLPLCLQQTTN